jgi:hypothetical protein
LRGAHLQTHGVVLRANPTETARRHSGRSRSDARAIVAIKEIELFSALLRRSVSTGAAAKNAFDTVGPAGLPFSVTCHWPIQKSNCADCGAQLLGFSADGAKLPTAAAPSECGKMCRRSVTPELAQFHLCDGVKHT